MPTTLTLSGADSRRGGSIRRGTLAAGLPLLAALVVLRPAPAAAADAAFQVSYLEAPVSAVNATRTLLQRYAASERAAAVNAGAGAFHIDVLQEVDRPERWLLLEWADSQSRLQGIEAGAAEDFARLQSTLVAPPDRRTNHPLPAANASPAAAADSSERQLRAAVYVVSHLDIGTQDQSIALPAVENLVDAARSARGNLRAEAWQQDGRANHYALLFVWRTRADHDAFAAAALAHQFRTSVGPLLGSPYDERLYRLAN